MPDRDDNNLMLARSVVSADQINAEFYSRFPYPWRAIKFDYLQDPAFEVIMLNQDIGAYRHDVVPQRCRIWIAGCGTNQAVFKALRFPKAQVLGSDVSPKSLEICHETASALQISNLELKRESINETEYFEEFDYVVSTGVIHHNADPSVTLRKIASALKPSGILELMVYNRFHWIVPAAFQKAIRILKRTESSIDFDSEVKVARALIEELPQQTGAGIISEYRECSEAMLADELLQPVLHSYTVESLEEMADDCGLEILLPCFNQLDKAEGGRSSWNIAFQNTMLREIYESLPDLHRWHVTNLVSREHSPQLWFYLQRKDSGRQRQSERQVCENFLRTVFTKAETTQKGYVQSDSGAYRPLPNSVPFPSVLPDQSVKRIVSAVDGQRTMKEILGQLEIESCFATVGRARVLLTTPTCPYLRAVGQNTEVDQVS